MSPLPNPHELTAATAIIVITLILLPSSHPTAATHLRNRIHSQQNREFLDAHNKARARAGEPPLSWDKGLARLARRFGRLRSVDCQMVHSQTGGDAGGFGENLFWAANWAHWSPSQVVRVWVSEHRNYDRHANTCNPGVYCGHYTQVVWRDTRRLGCAFVECLNGGLFASCLYDPPGNYVEESPFDLHLDPTN